MISAQRLKFLTTMSASELTNDIRLAGYKKDSFKTAKFLGLTNGGEFCYTVTYVEDGETQTTKVFVKFDPANDRVSVDY